MDPVSQIGLDEYMNCVLVQHDVRPAFLIQPADYREATSKDPKTKKKILAIQEIFPELVISIINGEALVSKKAYTSSNFRENKDMGDALGYPCADDYAYTLEHKDEPSVGISIYVTLKDEKPIQLLANACKDEKKTEHFTVLARKADAVFKSDPRLKDRIVSVDARVDHIVPTKFVLQKLLRNEKLNENEEYQLRNEIANLGFQDENYLADYEYQFNNPTHRGILISLMTLTMNNPMEPFWPLQFRREGAKVDAINNQWGVELVRVLNETRDSKAGGKRKSRRNK